MTMFFSWDSWAPGSASTGCFESDLPSEGEQRGGGQAQAGAAEQAGVCSLPPGSVTRVEPAASHPPPSVPTVASG